MLPQDLVLTPAAPPTLSQARKRFEVVVAGGGMAGVGAAITAARHGARVALLQDRPVLGGNGSKEIRVWLQGARGGANNAWFRETGLMEELLLENQYKNQDGEAELWDAILLDKTLAQERLELMLNTSVLDLAMRDGKIASVRALTLHSELLTTLEGACFIDCTGDGTLGSKGRKPYRRMRGPTVGSKAPPVRRAYASAMSMHRKRSGSFTGTG